MTKRTFKVVFEPDDGGWHTSIPEVQGCRTWGRSLGAARRYIREALSTCEEQLGKNVAKIAETAEFEEEFKIDDVAASAVADARRAREELELLQEKTLDAMRVAASVLKHQGVSVRDAADILGLSHQRVQQLNEENEELGKRHRASQNKKAMPREATARKAAGR